MEDSNYAYLFLCILTGLKVYSLAVVFAWSWKDEL